ncbi:MAG: UbiA family prenyltransferase [Holophagaceae bacterium]
MSGAPFALRAAFEKLLGREALAYLLHLRPMEWPIMTAHLLLGALWASGLGAFAPGAWPWTLLGWFAFVALLNGGTLAINSAFDNDEGDIGYLKAPPKPPRHLLAFSVLLLAASLAAALPFFRIGPSGGLFFWTVLGCVVMSVLYSVPPVRLKARAGWDLLINCLGFGFLTPLAGWALSGRPVPAAVLWACAGFGLLFAALYPMTQIYQVAEDRARGDRTLVIRMSVPRSLDMALAALALAHGAFARAAWIHGRQPLWLAGSLAAWLLVLVPWRLAWARWTDAQHEAGMYRGLVAWAITDLSLLALLWPRG